MPPTPESVNDGDFVQNESETDSETPEDEASEADLPSPTPTVRGRVAARKARANIKATFVEHSMPLNQKTAK